MSPRPGARVRSDGVPGASAHGEASPPRGLVATASPVHSPAGMVLLARRLVRIGLSGALGHCNALLGMSVCHDGLLGALARRHGLPGTQAYCDDLPGALACLDSPGGRVHRLDLPGELICFAGLCSARAHHNCVPRWVGLLGGCPWRAGSSGQRPWRPSLSACRDCIPGALACWDGLPGALGRPPRRLSWSR